MVDNEQAEVAASSKGAEISESKQAACYACRKSKVKCSRLPNAGVCQRCANSGTECVVPSYHVGRYKGVKNKRSGLEKAIHQVEKALKKTRTDGSMIHDEHAQALHRVIDESRNNLSEISTSRRSEALEGHIARRASWESARGQAVTNLQDQTGTQLLQETHASQEQPEGDGDVTVNNASNPLQLLAIASAIPEPIIESSASTPMTGTSLDEDRTQNFFRPMVSKLDVAKDLDPVELGLVSDQEVQILFDFFHNDLAHTRWGLDREIHSADFVRSRSAYLFTSILACAALFLHDTASLSVRLNNHRRFLAHRIWAEGYRSLEIVLAYMINIPWMQPGKNWANDDDTCYFLSIALTIAIDLSLNKIVTPSTTMRSQDIMEKIATADCIEGQRALNIDGHFEVDPTSVLGRRLLRARERTWLALFALDRGVCLARGRPWTVPTGPLIDTCDAWHISDIVDPWDGSLVATTVLRRDFATLVANVRMTCDSHRLAVDGGANIVKLMREKVEGFFAQWYHTWTYQIKQGDGTLPPYVEILVSHGKLSAYCNVINHPTASMEVKQFFKAAGLTSALHVIRTAVSNEPKLRSMPNNSVIMVSFAACFVLGLSTSRRQGNVYIADHIRDSIYEAADVLERIGSVPKHRMGASTLFGRYIKRIMRLHTASITASKSVTRTNEDSEDGVQENRKNGVTVAPYTLQPMSDTAAETFPGFNSMTDDQLLAAIQNSRYDIENVDAGLLNDDGLFMDWLDWPNIT